MPSFLGYVEQFGKLPARLTFSLAALMAFYQGDEIKDGALIGNRNGEEYVLEGTELLARAICHETDHLDGHLYIDFAEYMYEPEEEERVSPRLRKYARRKDK